MKEKLEDLYYTIIYSWLKLHKIGEWCREVKYFYQRGKRGYADCDVWNIDWSLAELIPKMLRELAKNNNGCPDQFFNQKDAPNQCKAWVVKLEEIAQGFDDYVKAQDLTIETTYEDFKEKYDKLMANFHKQGAEFIRLYGNFWD